MLGDRVKDEVPVLAKKKRRLVDTDDGTNF